MEWRELFVMLIMLLAGFLGSPIIQAVKNFFSWAFKKPVEERWALLVAAIVSFLIALLEVWLAGLVDFQALDLQSIPTAFGIVFSIATIYYQLFKGSPSALGEGGLLKRYEG
jgi:hypothetical protein